MADMERLTYADMVRESLEGNLEDYVVRKLRSHVARIPKDHDFYLTEAEREDALAWLDKHFRKQGLVPWLANKVVDKTLTVKSEFCPCGSRVLATFYGGGLVRVYERTGSPCTCTDSKNKVYAILRGYDPDTEGVEITFPSGTTLRCRID